MIPTLARLHLTAPIIALLAVVELTAAQAAENAGAPETAPALLTRADAQEDLIAFAQRLREESAYLQLRQARPFDAIDALQRRLPDSISTAEFARELRKVLSPMGDCHSSINYESEDQEPGLWLPFRIASAKGGIIAVKRDNSSFVEPDHPYLVAVDGKPLQEWMDAALLYEPVGSPSQNLHVSLKGIRRLDILRRDLGIPESSLVTATFANAAGIHKQVMLPCRSSFSSLAEIKLGGSRRIGSTGYLRLPEMDDHLIPEAKRRMEEFRDTSGLIIDVRGNGGGRYGLMRALFGYFWPDDAGPFVCNIAAYRLAPQFKKNHIEYRPTHRRDWPGWSTEDVAAIDAAMKSFTPSFKLPPGQFSEWHFMLLRREAFQYHYDKPVIVLCDEKCISAADGFLAAFSELPKATLMGAASRGGSGSSRTVKLPRSGIAFRLSTMASFRPNGDTFEGKGVAVDIEAHPEPGDFINARDSVLEQALQKLSASS